MKKRPGKLAIHCPVCNTTRLVVHRSWRPATAVRADLVCIGCFVGGRPPTVYYDLEGKQLVGEEAEIKL